MASVGDVLAALGNVAGGMARAAQWVAQAHAELVDAHARLTETLAGHNESQAADALNHMAVAIDSAGDVDTLLTRTADQLSSMVEKIRQADGTVTVSPGARAARAPVAGRVHPTNTPVLPPHARDHEWAGQIGDQLTEWIDGKPTEALVFDTDGNDWQVNSGVDAELTAAARIVVDEMIATGKVGNSPDPLVNHSERAWLKQAVTHAETKAAVWAAANGKRFIDVVTNRKFVCGQIYQPGERRYPPGCFQAVGAILPVGYRMRVWRRGRSEPLIIEGQGRNDRGY
jgi:SCP1.201-like deaminase